MSRKEIVVSSKYNNKQGETKTRYTKVGSAFLYEDGNISLQLDPGVSISSIEGVKITIKEPYDPKGRDSAYFYKKPAAAPLVPPDDSDIPF